MKMIGCSTWGQVLNDGRCLCDPAGKEECNSTLILCLVLVPLDHSCVISLVLECCDKSELNSESNSFT